MQLLLVGCGKMGGALLRGWMRHASASNICLVDPTQPPDDLLRGAGVVWYEKASALPKGYRPSAIVLAIKPQHMAAVLPDYAAYRSAVFLSIAAGQTLHRLQTLLGGQAMVALVRAMPNLPASIGQGMSVAVANAAVSASQRKLCDALLKACGQVAWVSDEVLLDPVTALSGSGPAYVFALTEAMATAGERIGLAPELALELARQTVIGAGAMLAQTTQTPGMLRKSVTSPGGTTAAAMDHLLAENGLTDLLLRAIRAACARSRELAS